MGSSGSKRTVPFKCVVIGETGSGKTSFLNLLGNLPRVWKLTEAEDLTLQTLKHFHAEANTENCAGQNKSQTNRAHVYKPPGIGFDLTIIDTPGFGDTDGLSADEKHCVSIQRAIESQDVINCIIVVINGRVPRVSNQLRYVLANICAILPKQILNQIVVVFTQVADPDDDLQFNPAWLTEFFGKPVGEDRQLCLDNPYAKVANLMTKGSKNTSQKLKIIKGAFVLTSSMLTDLFTQISTFSPVSTNVFKQLYEVKQDIDKTAKLLNSKLMNLNDDRARAEQLKVKLSTDETAMEAVEDFKKQKQVPYWDYEETPTRHHMICGECNSNCHMDCNILKGMDKTASFKDCECFQWKRRKNVKVLSQSDRQHLLDKLFETETKIVSDETGEELRKEWRIKSKQNFNLNGTEIRGDPETQWTSSLFYTHADGDDGFRLAEVQSKIVPFDVTLSDWSNVERGQGMLCKTCNHSLAQHSHQTCYHVRKFKDEIQIDSSKMAEYNRLSGDVQQQKKLLEDVTQACKDMEQEEQRVKTELKQNLSKFKQIAASSSYLTLLREQKLHLETLKKTARTVGSQEALNEQLQIIDTMLKEFA